MTLSSHRSFRVLAAVFCSLGVLGLAGGAPATWIVLPLSALLSALLLPGALVDQAPIPVKADARRQTT
jgi:hypothetical protein